MTIDVVYCHFPQKGHPDRPARGVRHVLVHLIAYNIGAAVHYTYITWLVGNYGKASLLDFLLVFVTTIQCLFSSILSKFNLLFFKINVGRVKFDWGAEDCNGALLILVTERLVFGEALEENNG